MSEARAAAPGAQHAQQTAAASRCSARRPRARATLSRCPRDFFSAPKSRPHQRGSPVYGASSTAPSASIP